MEWEIKTYSLLRGEEPALRIGNRLTDALLWTVMGF